MSIAQRILGETSHGELEDQVERWLVRGLAERGLGAKTSAGYGILHVGAAPRVPERPVRSARPVVAPAEPDLPAGERYARQIIPDDLDRTRVGNALDRASDHGTPEEVAAVARRFVARFPLMVEKWRRSPDPKKTKKMKKLGLLEEPSDDP